MNDTNKNKTTAEKLREAFWEKKKTRKISSELKEIFEKHSEETSKQEEAEKKVARPYRPEAGV